MKGRRKGWRRVGVGGVWKHRTGEAAASPPPVLRLWGRGTSARQHRCCCIVWSSSPMGSKLSLAIVFHSLQILVINAAVAATSPCQRKAPRMVQKKKRSILNKSGLIQHIHFLYESTYFIMLMCLWVSSLKHSNSLLSVSAIYMSYHQPHCICHKSRS